MVAVKWRHSSVNRLFEVNKMIVQVILSILLNETTKGTTNASYIIANRSKSPKTMNYKKMNWDSRQNKFPDNKKVRPNYKSGNAMALNVKDLRLFSDPDNFTSKAIISTWDTQTLLSALDERNIRYSPSASRLDLVEALVKHCRNKKLLDDENDKVNLISRHDNILNDVNSSRTATVYGLYSFDQNVYSKKRMQKNMEERNLKRARRQHQHQTRRDIALSTMRHMLPGVTGKILDYAKRRARRLQRRVEDLLLLDDDTGVRDVIRYKRTSAESKIVVVPDEFVEIISSDGTSQSSPTSVMYRKEKRAMGGPFDEIEPTFRLKRFDGNVQDNRHDIIHIPHKGTNSKVRKTTSRSIETARNDKVLCLPYPANRSEEEVSAASSYFVPPNGIKTKTIYNPYRTKSGLNDEKDVIDRVAVYLSDTADRIMWGMFDHIDDTASPNTFTDQSKPAGTSSSQQSEHDVKSWRSRAKRQSQQRNINTQRKHWKDRLEERLDSMLGLHENGDFYRSWSERYGQEQRDDSGNDAFSVAQGRKTRRRSRPNPVYSRPFWEEEGNIFSLLFGRSHQFTAPHIGFPSGLEGGSVLSIFRFAMQCFLVFANYICRWASTQGAIPQPVVVFGVTSAMLCAPPRRRLFTTGVVLLVIRTVGEVLHGYISGSDGWESNNDISNIDNDGAKSGQFDDNWDSPNDEETQQQ
jgi:hypothetical protein